MNASHWSELQAQIPRKRHIKRSLIHIWIPVRKAGKNFKQTLIRRATRKGKAARVEIQERLSILKAHGAIDTEQPPKPKMHPLKPWPEPPAE